MGWLQGKTGSIASGSTVSFNSNTTPGTLLIVVLSRPGNGGTFSISDSADQNNAWTLIQNGSSYPTAGVAYALKTTGGSTDTITLTCSGGGTIYYFLGEYSGVNSVRGTTPWAMTASGSTTTETTSSITTTAGDLLIGCLAQYSTGTNQSMSPLFAAREGVLVGSASYGAYGDIAAVGGSQSMTLTMQYYSGIAMLAFYQKAGGVPNSLALLGAGV